MNEYIKRSEAKIVLQRCDIADPFRRAEAFEELESIPASDVRPVVHAYWIEDDNIQVCSNCGEEHEWVDYRAAYCDTCGAKMDGRADE